MSSTPPSTRRQKVGVAVVFNSPEIGQYCPLSAKASTPHTSSMHTRSARLLLSAAQLVRPLLVPPSSLVPRGMMMRWSVARAVMTASGDTEVSLFYERPLRDFLSGGSRSKERLSLPSDQPFPPWRHQSFNRLSKCITYIKYIYIYIPPHIDSRGRMNNLWVWDLLTAGPPTLGVLGCSQIGCGSKIFQ